MKIINFIRQSAAALIAAVTPAGCRDDDRGEKSPYTVAFDSADGSAVASQTAEDGGTPVTAGITLTAGWMEEGSGGTGDGTEASPFRVATEADLRRVGAETATGGWTLSAHYLQTADITLTEDWTPIGSSVTNPFRGVYNGGGKTVRGLKINAPAKEYQGLFGNSNGIIKNVGLIDVNINGSAYAGGIAGANNGTIQGCFVSGHVRSSCAFYAHVGGITGDNRRTIENCYASCSVVGEDWHCGGIAGSSGSLWSSRSSSMRYCYATGSVTGEDIVGGIAGSTVNYDGTVLQNCVALNSRITATLAIDGLPVRIGRICGDTGAKGVYSDNCSGPSPLQYNMDASRIDGNQGIFITEAEYRSAAWWSGTAGFPAGAWIFEDGRLPVLKGFAAGIQNPQNPPGS